MDDFRFIMKHLLLALVCIVMSITYAADFKTYYNDRFNYQIKYPAFLKPQGESENSDGQVFSTKDVELRVWGSYFPETINESVTSSKEDIKGYRITHEIKKNNSYTLRGENNDRIIYFKTIYVCGENINMRLYYPKHDKTKWAMLINQIALSLQFIGECKKS